MNLPLLRSTWADALAFGDSFVAHFYGRLFLAHPELRPLFGTSMEEQRAKIADTLDLVVQGADNLEGVAPRLRRLGRMHRRFGVTPDMFGPVGEALLATFARFLGDDWTDEAAATWTLAFEVVAGVMLDAYHEAEQDGQPATWDVLVLEVERSRDVLHLALDVDPGFPWAMGAMVPVRLVERAGTWRSLTMAGTRNLRIPIPDRPDSVTLDLLAVQPGDHLLLGVPVELDMEVDL